MKRQRIERLRTEMSHLKVDAFLVTAPKNIRYLADFTGSAGSILITNENAYFITDFRYTAQAKEQAQGFEVIIHKDGVFQTIKDILERDNISIVAIEGDDLNVTTYLALQKLFSAQIKETSGVIEYIREIKDYTEIEKIKKAVEIQDKAYSYILTFIKPGMTEIEVANELERYIKELGGSAMSFDTIVASGVRSSMPHGVASEKVIENGDLITLDFGCYYEGYSGDMTRTFAIGNIDPKLKEIYHIVYEAQRLVNENIRVGMTGAEVDALARDYIESKGYGEAFGHSTGHGLGLDVHEGPRIAQGNDIPLVAGNVVTNEPGIYIDGLGGVRIEDDIVLTEEGPIVLNQSPKELIII